MGGVLQSMPPPPPCYLMFFSSEVRAFTTALKASSLPGATHLSGCSRTASFLYALFTSSLEKKDDIRVSGFSRRRGGAASGWRSDSPRGAGLHPQHVPGVLAVADASDGVGLLLGEAHADLRHRPLPAVLTHVGDGGEERLQTRRSRRSSERGLKQNRGLQLDQEIRSTWNQG